MNRFHTCSRNLIVLLVVAVLFGVGAVKGQGPEQAWSQPVNLSRSGAAGQPQIVAGLDGRLQTFWWDRFDGLTTARFDGETWSDPVPAPIWVTEEVGNEFVTEPIDKMPTIVADARGWAYAFWLGKEDEETGVPPLMRSQTPVGSTYWLSPTVLVESAVAFDVAAASSGALTLAYVRTLHDAASSAGVYVKRTAGGGAGWGPSVAVYRSIYFRLLTAETAHVRMSDAGDGTVHLAWDDSHLGQALYARSTDGGFTWSDPESLGEPDQRPIRPRVFALPGGSALRLWEAAGMGGCALYQQRFLTARVETPTVTPTPIATETLTGTGTITGAVTPTAVRIPTPTETLTPTWSAPQRVLEGVSRCPQGERSWLRDTGALWLWGEGSGALTLSAWDTESSRWSEPRSLSFRFQEVDTERWVGLSDLHAVLASDALAVVGSDPTTNEVWVTVGQVNALDLAFAPPPPWSAPVRLSQEGQAAGWPAVALDADGRVHVAWSQAPQGGGPGTALFYARWDASTARWSRAVEVVRGASGEEMVRQPALLADARGLLQLAWSSGEQGQIFHSRAQIGEAASSGGWSVPQSLSAAGWAGSWPQIGTDAAGRLYVVYAVPLNEGRGIYLTRSEDGGETWSEPRAIFSASAVDWAMFDRPALAVALDGTLHVAWVQKALPDTWPPQGIFYTRSTDDGASWTEPLGVAGTGYDWPRLALAGGQVHLLYGEVDGGGVWHRWAAAEGKAGSGWGTAARVPGWNGAAGSFGLAISGSPAGAGGSLHLVGVNAEGEALLYSTWGGSAGSEAALTIGGSRWSAAELFRLGPEVEEGLEVTAATLPQGGRLAVVLRALVTGEEEEAVPAVFAAVRTIPTEDVPPLPALVPTPRPTAAPSPTPEPTAVPSPTPDLTGGPPPSDSSYLPLILGGGLAAVIVVGVLVVRGLWWGRE